MPHPEFHTRPREVWTVAECVKAAKYAPKNHWGDRPPKGIIVGSSESYPRFGLMRFNGGIIVGDVWYSKGTNHPYPSVPEPYVLAILSTWGVIVTTKEDAAARKLPLLNLNAEGFEV